MKNNNVIVMTTGLSGSSVTSALIAQSGLWLGEETIVKNNSSGRYDTYENAELVRLNKMLYKEMNFEPKQSSLYEDTDFTIFEKASGSIDTTPYEEFIKHCNENGRWLWKDPRLWITLGFWLPLIRKHCGDNVKFVVLSREPLSMWTSLLLKRVIMNYGYLKRNEMAANKRISQFIASAGYDYVDVNYNDLTREPVSTIEKINAFLATNLTVDDYKAIYNGPIPTPAWTTKNVIKAYLIYLKNLNEAIGR